MEPNPDPPSAGVPALGADFATESPGPSFDADGDGATVTAAEAAPQNPADTLSPAVRRLVRQYDLDITGIHGTGPSGRIRVGDVIGMLGGRTELANRAGETARIVAAEADDGEPRRDDTATPASAPAAGPYTPPTTTVFECDLTRVLVHRKQLKRNETDILLTSYFLAACAEALGTVAEVVDGLGARFGVLLTGTDGTVRASLVDAGAPSPASPDEQLRALDAALRRNVDADLRAANVLVHHYGAGGSLIATPTPLGAGHAASIGIGRARRQITVRTGDAEETPRVAALCHVSLTFLPDRVAFDRANRFMAHVVRALEQWPEGSAT